jgi:large subunit ribosomal protein L13
MTTFEVDAKNQSLGRIASRIAIILRGKNSPSFDPAKLSGHVVVVNNLLEAKFTGKKLQQKVHHHYSGYHGGLKTKKLSDEWADNPQKVLRNMVYSMLPKNRIREIMIKNLKFSK